VDNTPAETEAPKTNGTKKDNFLTKRPGRLSTPKSIIPGRRSNMGRPIFRRSHVPRQEREERNFSNHGPRSLSKYQWPTPSEKMPNWFVAKGGILFRRRNYERPDGPFVAGRIEDDKILHVVFNAHSCHLSDDYRYKLQRLQLGEDPAEQFRMFLRSQGEIPEKLFPN
jgi:hypothetical protein